MADVKLMMWTLLAVAIVYSSIQIAFIPSEDAHTVFTRSTSNEHHADTDPFTLDAKSITLRRPKSAASGDTTHLTADEVGANAKSGDDILASITDVKPKLVNDHVKPEVAPPVFGVDGRGGVSSSLMSEEGRSQRVSESAKSDQSPPDAVSDYVLSKVQRKTDPSSGQKGSLSGVDVVRPGYNFHSLSDNKSTASILELNNRDNVDSSHVTSRLNVSRTMYPIVSADVAAVLQQLNNSTKKELENSNGLARNGDRGKYRKNYQDAFVQGGIFWSERVESALPSEIPYESVRAWSSNVRTRRVVRLLPGCGRESNRLAILDSGEKLCCRYRQNFDQIQGEILSFYLARLLGIDNVPLSVLLAVDSTSEQWLSVKENITRAGWKDGFIIVATKWIPGLEPAYMPVQFRGKNRTFHFETFREFASNLGLDELSELVQWSDLILFDFLTANLDRIVNTYVNLQWNKYMFEQPVHNLQLSTSDNRLVFLDNESGMLHGYRLLPQYSHYHEKILKSLCMFRVPTVTRLLKLHSGGGVWDALKSMIEKEEPLFENLPSFPLKFRNTVGERVATSVEHITKCQLVT